jgi:capsular exopolysaccharide synthesis family protein
VSAKLQQGRSDIAEAYNAVAIAISFSTTQGLPKILFFTSSQTGEGKTTTSYGLALSLSRMGKSVVLVDGDLRRPSLHEAAGTQNDVGLSNLLTGQATVNEATQQIDDRLSIITSGPLPPNPAQLLAQPSVGPVLQALKAVYDCVIVDGPPVLGLADAPVWSGLSDATVFVVEAGRSYRGRAKASLGRLRQSRSKIIGAVLTKLDTNRAGYAKYYGADYYKYGSRAKTATDAA